MANIYGEMHLRTLRTIEKTLRTIEKGRRVKNLIIILPWVLSASTLWMKISTGNKSRHAWLHGLINQAIWFVWIPVSHNWGLLPMTIGLTIIYVRNHFKWNSAEERAKKTDLAKGM